MESSASEELSFLKNQVQRLNIVLSRYQEKYNNDPQIDNSNISENDIIKRPIVDHRLLTPLILEYDIIIEELKQQLDIYQNEHRKYRVELENLVEENDRLNKSLKDQVHLNMINKRNESSNQESQLNELRLQLQISKKENDTIKEMWQSSVAENNHLEKELDSLKKNPRIQSLEQQAKQIKRDYMSTVDSLHEEIEVLKKDLQGSQNDTHIANVQVQELKAALQDLKNKLLAKEEGSAAKIDEQRKKDFQIRDLQNQINDLTDKLQSGTEALEESRYGVISCQNKISQLETENELIRKQFKTNEQIVEEAILMQNQCLIKEKQAVEEVDRLKALLDKLVDEAGAKTRAEVDEIKKQCNQRVEKLMNQIQRLEIESLEKQGEMDRLKRERKAAEIEIERIYKEGNAQGASESNKVVELTMRACSAEKSRDEINMKLETIANQLRIENDIHKQDKSLFETEIESLKERNISISRDLEIMAEEKMKQEASINNLHALVIKCQQERDAVNRSSSKQLILLQGSLSLREKEYETKLSLIEDAHRKSIFKLRQMMNQHQLNAVKYKEECNNLKRELETKSSQLKEVVKEEQKRIDELTKLLRQSNFKIQELESKLSLVSRNYSYLESQIDKNQKIENY